MQFLIVLIFFVGSSMSSPSYEYFSPQQSEIENSLDSIEASNRRELRTNQIVECEDVFQSIGLNELQNLIEAVASKKETSPFVVLRMLYKRIQNREESIMTAMDDIPRTDIHTPPLMAIPPLIRLPPPENRAPYSLSPTNPSEEDDTKVVIIPMAPPPHSNKMPKPDLIPFNAAPVVNKINHVLPSLLSPLKMNHFRPPLGALVRVNSGDLRNPINRDITISVSPLMTILEALRQAEIKYQNILGLSHDMEVIAFSHSASMDCYLVNSINDVEKSAGFGWKIIITDRDSHVLYDDFCLPNDILVKPGTIISLSYVPIYHAPPEADEDLKGEEDLS